MNVFFIAIVILVILGIGCCFAPRYFTRSDQRDDPEAVEKVKKLGPMLIGFAVFALLLELKYKS